MRGDGAALLRAVLDDPASDAPRLVYADWLEENAGAVPCPRCAGRGLVAERPGWETTCPACRAAGRGEAGRAARAEFIRVQCELEKDRLRRIFRKNAPRGFDRKGLYRRERELLGGSSEGVYHVVRAGAGVSVATPQGFVLPEWAFRSPDFAALPAVHGMAYGLRRGFVERAECGPTAWCGGPCGRCQGIGYGPAGAGAVDARRCPDCNGTGRTPALGPAVVAAQPVVEVRLVDCRPYALASGRCGWLHPGVPQGVFPTGLRPPDAVFARLTGHTNHWLVPGPLVKWYETRQLADAALSRACVDWARAEAGLPPLAWPEGETP